MSGNIILIASYPKSGNTWVRAFLTSAWRDGSDLKLNQLMVASASGRRFLDAVIGISSAEFGADELGRLRPAIYDLASKRVRPGKRLFLKMHDALMTPSRDIPAPISMESVDRIIYLIRDPRGVAPSLARHLGVSIDDAITAMADRGKTLSEYPWRPGDHVIQRISSWTEHVKSWACRPGGPPICVTRFEDMVAKPEATFTAMVKFLNLALPAGRISLAVAATTMSVLQQKEAVSGFREKPAGMHRFFHQGRPESWRAALTPAQVAAIEMSHAEVMHRFGYSAEAHQLTTSIREHR
jgi:aryl sulfotransferase